MTKRLELLMYLLFAVAALPLAWIEVNSMAYYLANPQAIEVRDSALEVQAVLIVLRYALYPLAPATLLALFFIVVGPRPVRINIVVLGAVFCSLSYLSTLFAFNSPGRLYLEGATIVLFLLLSVSFLAFRWKSDKVKESKESGDSIPISLPEAERFDK